MKKILSLLLSILLVFSLCVPAFAENDREYDYYLCLGDSIPAGSGMENDNYTNEKFAFVPNSYPWLIMQSLGYVDAQGAADLNHGFNGAHAGMRVAEQLACLTNDMSYTDDYTWNMFNAGWGGTGVMDEETGFVRNHPYDEDIARADLITIELGNNDIASTLLYHLSLLLESEESEYSGAFDEAIAEATALGDPNAAFIALLTAVKDTYESTDQLLQLLAKLALSLEQNGVSEFFNYWDILMGELYRINDEAGKKADVLVLGIYNPCETMLPLLGLDEEASLQGAELFQPIIDLLNYEMQYGSKYSNRYTFVDVAFMRDVLNTTGVDILGCHPTTAGHAIMAEYLIGVIKNLCRHEHTETVLAVQPSFAHDGYSGDVFCKDCGKLIEQGSILTRLGQSVDVPSSLGYKLIEKLLPALLNNLFGILSNIVTTIIPIR